MTPDERLKATQTENGSMEQSQHDIKQRFQELESKWLGLKKQIEDVHSKVKKEF